MSSSAYKCIKPAADRAEISTVFTNIQLDCLDKPKTMKVFTLHQIKEKRVDDVKLNVVKVFNPGNTQHG